MCAIVHCRLRGRPKHEVETWQTAQSGGIVSCVWTCFRSCIYAVQIVPL